jgi:hypothetical protein
MQMVIFVYKNNKKIIKIKEIKAKSGAAEVFGPESTLLWSDGCLVVGGLQKEIDDYRINNYSNTQMRNILYESASFCLLF